MKKYIIMILVLMTFISLSAVEVSSIFQEDHFYMRFNSFLGTDYFADREYKSTNYFDRHHFFAGWKYNFHENTDVWFDLTFDDKFYEKEILLNRVGVSYQKADLTCSYQIDRLQYGAESEIYSIQVKDRFYAYGVIEDYRYNGVQADYTKNKFSAKTLVAANDFNAVITNSQLAYNSSKYLGKFYYLAVARNEEYNVRNHSIGLENTLRFTDFTFYTSGVYQYLPTYAKGDKFKQLVEANYKINESMKIGMNYFYEDFTEISNPNAQFQSYLNLNIFNWENYLIYRNNLMQEFTEDYRNIEYSGLLQYQFAANFKLGINYSFFQPDFDQNYHQIGFQVNYNYEKDL